MNIISELEHLTYKLGVNPAEQRDITKFSFWYKQVFHCLGGFILGLPGLLTVGWALVGVLLVAYLVYSELGDSENGQPFVKTILDISMWLVGFAIPFIL